MGFNDGFANLPEVVEQPTARSFEKEKAAVRTVVLGCVAVFVIYMMKDWKDGSSVNVRDVTAERVFIDVIYGDDKHGDGSRRSPYKTLGPVEDRITEVRISFIALRSKSGKGRKSEEAERKNLEDAIIKRRRKLMGNLVVDPPATPVPLPTSPPTDVPTSIPIPVTAVPTDVPPIPTAIPTSIPTDIPTEVPQPVDETKKLEEELKDNEKELSKEDKEAEEAAAAQKALEEKAAEKLRNDRKKEILLKGGCQVFTPKTCLSPQSVVPEDACSQLKDIPFLTPFCSQEDKALTRCFSYGTGTFEQAEADKCPPRAFPTPLKQCTRGDISRALSEVVPSDNGHFGRKMTPRGFYVTLDNCNLMEYRREEILALWKGKQVAITGGGGGRQMFMKLVYILRGMEWDANIEHSGGLDYYYATTETEDLLTLTVPAEGETPLPDPVLEVFFRYKVSRDYYAPRAGIDVHITVLTDWQTTEGETAYDNYVRAAMANAKERESSGFQYILVTGNLAPVTKVAEINAYFSRLASLVTGQPNAFSIDLGRYSELGYFKSAGGIAYMCSTVLPYPSQASQGTIDRFKSLAKAGLKCKDHFNENLWKLVLNSVADEGPARDDLFSPVCSNRIQYDLEWGGACAHKGSKLPAASCEANAPPVLKSFCRYPENCFTVGNGILTPKPVDICEASSPLPKCNWKMVTEDLAAVDRWENGPYSWQRKEKGEVVKSSTCDLREYTRADILRLFHGKKILLTGDSLTRQMFKKFVNIMRGRMWDYNFEYKGHASFMYGTNETHDVFVIDVKKGTGPLVENQILEIQFQWDPKPVSFNPNIAEVRGPVDIHIGSIGVWWESNSPETAHDRYMEGAMEYAKRNADRGYKYFFMPGTIVTRFRNQEVPGDNSRLPKLERLSKRVTEPNTYSFSMTNYSKLGYFPTTDGMHYMCGAANFYPIPVGQKSVTMTKEINDAGHMCFDHYGANLWTIIFNAFDGFI